jgi:hypothetical protein
MPKVIVVPVGGAPKVETIAKGLEAMQQIVGGYIENVTLEDGIGLICNEEGKLHKLPENRTITEIQDVVRGDFFISRFNDEGETVDVTPEDVAKYTKRFSLA